MGALDTLLGQSLLAQTNNAYQNNALYTGGQNLTKFQPQYNPNVSDPSTSYLLQALLAPLMGGIYQGIGEGMVADDLRPKYLDQMADFGATPSMIDRVNADSWDPRTDSTLLESLAASVDKRDRISQLNQTLMPRGYEVGADGQVVEVPEMRNMLLEDRTQALRMKPLSDTVTKDFSAKVASIENIKSLASEIGAFADARGTLEWWKGSLDPFGITDSSKLQNRAKTIAQQYARAIEGGRLSDQDRTFYQSVLRGGGAWTPENVSKMLNIVAQVESDNVINQARTFEALRNAGIGDVSATLIGALAKSGSAGDTGLPSVGGTYNGQRVTNVRKVR